MTIGTKSDFLAAYRSQLQANRAWSSDPVKLQKFMMTVEQTLDGHHDGWLPVGECVRTAWREIGGKGRPTYKALRALS